MNKTVNINLAGIFFHIDEDAYLKLQRYLEAIKRSFTDSQGRSEIISDIEARISELFTERIKTEKQVIGMKEVDEVITIMGQPEDYLVDDEIFDDEPKSSTSKRSTKKLFRDTDNSYIGGVSSGLGHYLGIDVVWIRLLWILLALGSGGTFIFIYILFWVLVPEAVTTSDKLIMKGEPVNISNIEKKIKKGFDDVSETVKNVDYQKYGNKVKSSSQTFFDAIGNVIMFFLKIFAKLIGLILIITGALTIFSLFVSLLSLGTSSIFEPWWMDYPDALITTGMPIWLGSVMLFFLFGIPAFFVLYLGLKILINNLKSIGNVAKFSLLGLWLLSIVGLIITSISWTTEFSTESTVTTKHDLVYNAADTLAIKMVASDLDSYNNMYRNSGFEIKYNDDDEKVIFSRNLRVNILSTKDSLAFLQIEKEAKGKDYLQAKEKAERINYNFELNGNTLLLDNYLLTDYENKFRDQNLELFLYLPEGSYIDLNSNIASFLRHYRSSENMISRNYAGHLLRINEDSVDCLDCDDDSINVKVNINEDGSKVRIDEDGVIIKSDDVNITINKEGFKAESEDVKVNINEDGIDIKSDDDI